MNAYTGSFFLVTNHSLYKITVPEDLLSSPNMEKRSTREFLPDEARTLHVPIGGKFRQGYYVGITAKGVFKYNACDTESGKIEGLPPAFEDVPGPIRGENVVRTKSIVGLFFKHGDADNCFETRSQALFDPRWREHTREVLLAIGSEHPLITISRTGKYAVDPSLYQP